MVDAVDEMLIVQRGKELGYKLSDEQFKSVVDNIRKENKIENEEQFQAALKSENMTMSDLRRNLERQMIVSRVQQNEVMAKIGVTDDEAKKYYDAHLERVHHGADGDAARDPGGDADRCEGRSTSARTKPRRRKPTRSASG